MMIRPLTEERRARVGHILGIDFAFRISGRSRLLMAEVLYDPGVTEFLPGHTDDDEGEGCQRECD